jgi:hypothetical protein
MKLDLSSGAYIQIGGEMGKYNSLPIETLVKIAQDFQELLMTIAKFDLPSSEPIDLNNFKIELSDFKHGSAVPCFEYSPRVENKIGFHWSEHRRIVNEKFIDILEITNTGDYNKLKVIYPNPATRTPIVESLYSLINDFDDSPVNFVDIDESTNVIKPIFKIHKFKPAVKKGLIAPIVELQKKESESNEIVGRIKVTKTGTKTTHKILKAYSNSNYSLEYAPVIIITNNSKYHLKHPLRCLFEKEDDYFVIQSELLDIIGTGKNEDDAEISFADEFEFVFKKLNSLDDSQLTEYNQLIKLNINNLVVKVEQ